jgi:hypothetical protein
MTSALASRAFFAAVRPLFGGSLTQGQVDGLKADLEAWDAYGDGDDRKLAYILATDFLESAHTMQAVKETYNAKYDGDTQPDDAKVKRRLDDALKKGRIKTNYWRDGWFGRGKPQNTHKRNYEKVGKLVGLDFVSDPDLLLDLKISSMVMVRAMLAGTYTGKKLSDYINERETNYVGARAVVNGRDRAADIAEYAETFESALRAARHARNEHVADESLRAVEEALKRPAEPAEPLPPATQLPDETETPASESPTPSNAIGWLLALIIGGILAIGGWIGQFVMSFFPGGTP